jgi:hypothetical protein
LLFRAVRENDAKIVDTVPNSVFYRQITDELDLVGFDVCSGNGWISASVESEYPVDPISGNLLNIDFDKVNCYSLFYDLDFAFKYLDIVNIEAKEHQPWYPVAVLITPYSRSRLMEQLIAANSFTD